MSLALYGGITMKGGAIEQNDFCGARYSRSPENGFASCQCEIDPGLKTGLADVAVVFVSETELAADG